ncbi:hypothetical protein DL98DRAFT_551990 [Cadophora sp. DSE1049]|nr:hypothetical protein DL98DRAFT_551990 [Cadophora sp. DSE1049]
MARGISAQHPEYHITVLLRDVPAIFLDRFPDVTIVEGNFDNADLLLSTAAQNDIVIHSGKSKHEPSVRALIAGLLRTATVSSPRFFIRLGGTGAIADWADPTYYGRQNPKIDAAVHYGDVLKCAIICSCGVIMVPVYLEDILVSPKKQAFYSSPGTNTRSWVHISDLVSVYMKLVEVAAIGGGTADCGEEDYYFTASQEIPQLPFTSATGAILKRLGVIENGEPIALPLSLIKTFGKTEWAYMGYYTYACSTGTRSDRARKVLGYEPSGPSLFECLDVDFEMAVGGKK